MERNKEIWKQKPQQINEIYDDNKKCLTSKKDILKQTEKYLIENFQKPSEDNSILKNNINNTTIKFGMVENQNTRPKIRSEQHLHYGAT